MKQTISLYERIGASMTIFDQLTEFFFMESNQIKSTDDKKKTNAHTVFSRKDVKLKKTESVKIETFAIQRCISMFYN